MNVLVLATALRISGGLTILNQFIKNIPVDRGINFYIIVDASFKPIVKSNVHYILKDTSNWLRRICFDSYYVNRWISCSSIKFNLVVSLQNTAVNLKKINLPQIVYYHQFLPLIDVKWRFWSKKERGYFFYQKIYPLFITRFVDERTVFVVQSSFVRNALVKKFKILTDDVYVVRPTIDKIDFLDVVDYNLENGFVHFLYPATPLIYKNHIEIINALVYLRSNNINISNIKIHFTFEYQENLDLYNSIIENNLQDNIVFEGVLPYDKMLSFYKSADGLLFPSYIESFGLPLIEAASIGLPIIAADIEYAKEVLEDYEGVRFVEVKNTIEWANAIMQVCNERKKYFPYIPLYRNSWPLFWDLIEKKGK